MKLIYIHGANASGESFNYIREHLKHDDELVIEYSSKTGFEDNLSIMHQLLVNFDDMVFIGHSLGGIYSLHLAHLLPEQVLGAVTMSTPYGGSRAADYAKYFLPFSRLLRDIGPSSRPMKLTNRTPITHPWTNIVTTRGDSPWMVEPNDGVVTIASMRHRSDMEYIDLDLNHYEVVISKKTVNVIKRKLSELASRSN
jgi:pimeloyl-ACP methyl ester carboxylesterase